jgi:hypothetical protein
MITRSSPSDRRIPVRRTAAMILFASVVAACGGSSGSSTPTPGAVATVPATAAPTTAAVLTNPPPTQIPGCLPKCWFGKLTRPGALSGDYQTRYFFGGLMTVTVPDGWWGYEDSTSELSIGPAGSEVDRLEIWIDVYSVADAKGTQDESFERSAEGVTAFVAAEQGIEILDRGPATLGGLPAEAFVYRRAADAINQDPDCPKELQPCIVEFGYPEWDGVFAEGGPFHSRLVIAKATWGGEIHAVYAMFWADDSSYDADGAKAQAIVEGARLPAGVVAAPLSP